MTFGGLGASIYNAFFVQNAVKKHEKVTVCDACGADLGPKSQFATPVERLLVQNAVKTRESHRLRRLWSGLRSQITKMVDFGVPSQFD